MREIKNEKFASWFNINRNSNIRQLIVIITLLGEVVSVLLIGIFLKSYVERAHLQW